MGRLNINDESDEEDSDDDNDSDSDNNGEEDDDWRIVKFVIFNLYKSNANFCWGNDRSTVPISDEILSNSRDCYDHLSLGLNLYNKFLFLNFVTKKK